MARYEYWPRFGPENHTLVLPVELTFNVSSSTQWMDRNWLHSVSLSALYVFAIFAGQRFMATQKPIILDQALFWWNLGLATFSAMGAVRMVPELLWAVNSNSFIYSICTASYAQGVTGFWTEKFAFSKVFEFIDTLFIVLRKRPLIFLHWYHHVTVLIYTWMLYKDHTASGRWFIAMNYTVHAFMYTYYALRALKLRLPKWYAMLITIMQIAQMVVGVYIGIVTLKLKLRGIEDCQCTWANLYASFVLYGSYFLLFCNFFYHTYLKRDNRYAGGGGKRVKEAGDNNSKVPTRGSSLAKLQNGSATHYENALNGSSSEGSFGEPMKT